LKVHRQREPEHALGAVEQIRAGERLAASARIGSLPSVIA
jgi:hypothetical protein